MAEAAGSGRKSLALTVAVIAVVALALFGAAFAAVSIWNEMGDIAISLHGRLAMALGAALTLGLGGGLMFLVFYSSRRGYDELTADASSRPVADSESSGSATRRSTNPSGSATER